MHLTISVDEHRNEEKKNYNTKKNEIETRTRNEILNQFDFNTQRA